MDLEQLYKNTVKFLSFITGLLLNIYPIGNGDLSGFWEKPTAFSTDLTIFRARNEVWHKLAVKKTTARHTFHKLGSTPTNQDFTNAARSIHDKVESLNNV
jgi:hypothetical protein